MLVTNSIRIQIEYAIVFSSQSIYIYNALTLTNINQDSSDQLLNSSLVITPSLFILLFVCNYYQMFQHVEVMS